MIKSLWNLVTWSFYKGTAAVTTEQKSEREHKSERVRRHHVRRRRYYNLSDSSSDDEPIKVSNRPKLTSIRAPSSDREDLSHSNQYVKLLTLSCEHN